MKLASLLLIVTGVALLVVASLLGRLAALMPSYLADWLFWSALPVGALPVVMLLDLAGPWAGPWAGFGLEQALRRLLWLMPVAAVLMIPVLVWPNPLFGWAAGHGFGTPFGRIWMGHAAIAIRSIVYFAVWTVLASLFVRPPSLYAVKRRRGLAVLGLLAYLVTATLASVDWAMTTEPDWFSAEYGLLFITGQVVIAISVALLLAGPAQRMVAPRAAGSVLLLAVAVWLFLQFMQFLVIWSADKPSDIGWYLHRSNAGAVIVVGIAVLIIVAVPLALLLAPRGRRHPAAIPAMALAVLCGQALGMLWLITPSIRHVFILSGMDLLSFAGIGGVMVGLCLLTRPAAMPAEVISRHG
jgi:hypothetical protein